LELDDFDQADDEVARLFSGLFFLSGIQIQVIVIFHEVVSSIKAKQRLSERKTSDIHLQMVDITPLIVQNSVSNM
jgi:hypothetical protein